MIKDAKCARKDNPLYCIVCVRRVLAIVTDDAAAAAAVVVLL